MTETVSVGTWTRWGRRAAAALVLLGSGWVSYAAVSLVRQPRAVTAAVAAKADDEPRVNPFASANGTHLIAFVITASDCGWSGLPTTMHAVGSIRAKMRAAYGSRYAQVSVVGVALDEDLEEGLHFLAELGKGAPEGAFDQLMVGGSWLNEQVVRFVWREAFTEAASPQVLVIERPVNTEAYLSSSTIGVQNDRVVVNPIGSSEIRRWIIQGVPLDYPPYRAPVRKTGTN